MVDHSKGLNIFTRDYVSLELARRDGDQRGFGEEIFLLLSPQQLAARNYIDIFLAIARSLYILAIIGSTDRAWRGTIMTFVSSTAPG